MRSTDRLDTFNLQRFIQAQDPVFDRAQAELNAGRKRSHWMWFIFPQFAGLGGSDMSNASRSVRAKKPEPISSTHCWARGCARAPRGAEHPAALGEEIFGHPDDLKFHSSMTLFAQVAPDDSLFHQALNQYFHGILDDWTLSLMDSKQAQLPTDQG
jgi:uncharacterized protein (DUF1810 family)